MRIRISYEIVTEESAEEGDVAECGWDDEEGQVFDSPDDAAEWLMDSGGYFEPSRYPITNSFQEFWLTDASEIDYDERRYSYHFSDCSDADRYEVYIILRDAGRCL